MELLDSLALLIYASKGNRLSFLECLIHRILKRNGGETCG